MVSVLQTYLVPVNEVLNCDDLLEKINVDLLFYRNFNNASNSIDEYFLKGEYKKQEYINSKLVNDYLNINFKNVYVEYKDGIFSIELLLDRMSPGFGIKITKDKSGKLIFDNNDGMYNDFDINIIKKYWEDFIVLFNKLESRRDIFEFNNEDLKQNIKDGCLEVDLEIDKVIYYFDYNLFRIKKHLKLDTDLKDSNEYYMVNDKFSDLFSVSNDHILKRFNVNIYDLKPIFRDIYLKSINFRKDNQTLKKVDFNGLK